VIGVTASVFQIPMVGWFGAAFSTHGLIEMTLPAASEAESWERLRRSRTYRYPPPTDFLDLLVSEMEQYFRGTLREFTTSLDVSAHTPFRQKVWEIDCQIPYGQTRTYGWVAGQLDKPRAARAVGGALAANPIPIVIPCHRVVAKDGGLCGYAGGIQVKADLLALERGQPRLFAWWQAGM